LLHAKRWGDQGVVFAFSSVSTNTSGLVHGAKRERGCRTGVNVLSHTSIWPPLLFVHAQERCRSPAATAVRLPPLLLLLLYCRHAARHRTDDDPVFDRSPPRLIGYSLRLRGLRLRNSRLDDSRCGSRAIAERFRPGPTGHRWRLCRLPPLKPCLLRVGRDFGNVSSGITCWVVGYDRAMLCDLLGQYPNYTGRNPSSWPKP